MFDVQKASRVSDGFKAVHAKKSRMRGPMKNLRARGVNNFKDCVKRGQFKI